MLFNKKIIQKSFESFLSAEQLQSLPPEQVTALRDAFFAGVGLVINPKRRPTDLSDGSEWLKSIHMEYSLHSMGNVLGIDIDDFMERHKDAIANHTQPNQPNQP